MGKKIPTMAYTQKENATQWMLFIGIILVGANLRAPLTSVGSLITFIRDDLSISNTVAGTITTLPLLAFALLSPFAPKIASKIGMERTIFISLIILLIGMIIRSLSGISFLFVGTIFIGLAIAIGNVLIPGYIKMNFPFRIGLVTGFYAVFMNIFGALSSGLSVPLSTIKGFGWKGSLAFWAILTFIALVFWLPQVLKSEKPSHTTHSKVAKKGSVWRSSMAWFITLFMGFQSLIFYTLITWLPDILQHDGYSASAAGWMLFLMQFALIPITFIIPIVAEKMRNQKVLGGLTGTFFIVGILGILLGYQMFMPIAIIMVGMACGSSFSLCMMFFSLRTHDGYQASEMSGMAQSFGYLLAAVGPTMFGALNDFSGGWVLPLSMLTGLSFIILIVAITSGRDKIIEGNTY